jgi:hypothetical protein
MCHLAWGAKLGVMSTDKRNEAALAALQISDNLLQDLQGLLLKLHSLTDDLRRLVDRVDQVIGEAGDRISSVVPEIAEKPPKVPP